MRRVSFPDFTAFSADAFWQSGGIFLSCQIIWTGWTCLASLPACLLPTFTQLSRWHPQYYRRGFMLPIETYTNERLVVHSLNTQDFDCEGELLRATRQLMATSPPPNERMLMR